MTKDKQPQKKPAKVDPLFQKPKEEVIPFEQPMAYGWITVAFPNIHDQNTVLELWLDEARKWINASGITQWSFAFAHGLPAKKHGERISPVFFFRVPMEASRFGWRFKGEELKAV